MSVDPFASAAGREGLRLLLLGGTSEARLLARHLAPLPAVRALTSLAGRHPGGQPPPGPVRVGGFGGVAGLVDFLHDHQVAAVLDATHPFATTITAHAATACAHTRTPLLVLRRPGWRAGPKDRWVRVPDMAAAARAVRVLPEGTVLLTTGRTDLHLFAGDPGHRYLARVLDPGLAPAPAGIELLPRHGAPGVEAELDLLRRETVCALVTKDSGAAAATAKLTAAGQLGIPVILVNRPPLPRGVSQVDSVAPALDWVRRCQARAASPSGAAEQVGVEHPSLSGHRLGAHPENLLADLGEWTGHQ